MPPIYRAPVFGQWARRIGQVEKIVALPCTDDPWLWIEGFFYNVPKLLWSFVGPDLNDSYFNRVGRKHGGKRGFTFNVEGFIEGDATDVELPGWGKYLFRLGVLAQEIGFWFMVVDATTDFLVNWTSTVYQWAGCRVGQGKFVKAYAGDQWIPPGFTARIIWADRVEGDGTLMLPGNVGVQHLAGIAGGAGFAISTSPIDFPGVPFGNLTAWMTDSAGHTIAESGLITPKPGTQAGTGSGFAMRAAPQFSGEQYEVFCLAHDGYVSVKNSAIWFSEGPDHSIVAGMGQSLKPIELPWAHP